MYIPYFYTRLCFHDKINSLYLCIYFSVDDPSEEVSGLAIHLPWTGEICQKLDLCPTAKVILWMVICQTVCLKDKVLPWHQTITYPYDRFGPLVYLIAYCSRRRWTASSDKSTNDWEIFPEDRGGFGLLQLPSYSLLVVSKIGWIPNGGYYSWKGFFNNWMPDFSNNKK